MFDLNFRLFSQLVTCVPTHKLPQSMTMGAASAQEIEMMERESMNDDASMVEDMGSRGQILWIRGLTRLQHQVSAYLRTHLLINLPFQKSMLQLPKVKTCYW